MLEALVAVSLAGNVVQFFHVAADVIAQTAAIKRTGKPRSLPELKKSGEEATKLAEAIKVQLSKDGPNLTQEDSHLLELATDCHNAGTEFLNYIGTFDQHQTIPKVTFYPAGAATAPPSAASGASSGPTHSNRASGLVGFVQSAQASIQFKWHHHKITSFEQTLDRFRSVLILSTILALRARTDAHNDRIIAHLQSIETSAQLPATLSNDSIRDLIDAFRSQVGPKLDHVHNQIRQCLGELENFRTNLPQIREKAILNWLNFRQMTWRYEEVPAAFQRTFQWIFDRPPNSTVLWDDFKTYLEKPDVVDPYWVNGKAGSGKSTLMKFIVDSPSTRKCLEQWAGGSELLMMNFFFWNLGTALQKSSPGMLRALLLAVLNGHPELIPAVFPVLYQTWTDRDAKVEPSYTELKVAFRLLLQKSATFVKLCLFVDGIDEFDGDHKDISIFLRSLASHQVKVIVSSRPINACINIFQGCPTLELQHLTKGDMEIFVKGNLSSHQSMVELTKRFPNEARELEQDILFKAEGVFLWVTIVVRLLVDGLEDGDSNMIDLQRKLLALPPGLRDLYERMLGKMSEEHQTQAAAMFQVLHTWSSLIQDQPLRSIVLSLATEVPSIAFGLEVAPFNEGTMQWRCDTIEAKVRSRCCGLLEIHKMWLTQPKNQWHDNNSLETDKIVLPTVAYLHRTVAEFLHADDVWISICEMTQASGFNPMLMLALASLSMTKVEETRLKSNLIQHMKNTLTFCRAAEITDQELDEIFAHLDRTVNQHMHQALERGYRPADQVNAHWSTDVYAVPSVPKSHRLILLQHSNRFCVAARCAFVRYLRTSGNIQSMNPNARYVLVTHAIEGWKDPDANVYLHDRSDTLFFLLQTAARPEDVGLGSSLWQHALTVCELLLKQEFPVECAELLRVFMAAAHSRRALILKSVKVEEGKTLDPMALIRQLRSGHFKLSSKYNGVVYGEEIAYLGNELERVAFSKLPSDEVSQGFIDTVAKVCSVQLRGATERVASLGPRASLPLQRVGADRFPIQSSSQLPPSWPLHRGSTSHQELGYRQSNGLDPNVTTAGYLTAMQGIANLRMSDAASHGGFSIPPHGYTPTSLFSWQQNHAALPARHNHSGHHGAFRRNEHMPENLRRIAMPPFAAPLPNSFGYAPPPLQASNGYSMRGAVPEAFGYPQTAPAPINMPFNMYQQPHQPPNLPPWPQRPYEGNHSQPGAWW